jgi:glycosyltransferase involved in cell wall biosynthesis
MKDKTMESSLTKKNKIRIANIYAPITLNSSWRTTIKRELTPKLYYEDTNFVFTKFKDQWVDIWDVYMQAHCFVWLLLLPLKLIRGRFHLFVTGVRYPEGIIAFVTGRLLRKPIIVRDSYWYWPNERLASSFLWPISRFAARHATVFVVNSQKVMNFWALSRVPKELIHTLHPYISRLHVLDRHFALANKIRDESKARYVVLYFGRLVKRKGVEYLVKAFSKLSRDYGNVVLFITGDGPEKPILEELCKDLDMNNVVFFGAVTEEDKPAYFLSCDLFVYPSVFLGIAEEWGLAVNEAMSVGKPVIITDVLGSAYELVRPQHNGYVVPERNVDAIHNAMRELLGDPNLRTRMGENGRRTIEEDFTIEQASESFLALIKIALGRGIEK